MKNGPAFEFYPERWMTGVAHMSDLDQIRYLRLLCHQWLTGGLPDNLTLLTRLAQGKISADVLIKFPVGEDGKRRNIRLETVRSDQINRITARSLGAALTNLKRRGRDSLSEADLALLESSSRGREALASESLATSPDTKQTVANASPPCTLYPVPQSTSTPKGREFETAFAEFWRAYPRKTAKGDALKAFKQVKGPEHLPAILEALKAQSQAWTDPQFIPYPASWLRALRWEDELNPQSSQKKEGGAADSPAIAPVKPPPLGCDWKLLERVHVDPDSRLEGPWEAQAPTTRRRVKDIWNTLGEGPKAQLDPESPHYIGNLPPWNDQPTAPDDAA